MTNAMKWAAIIAIALATVIFTLGVAISAEKEQKRKYDIECIDRGGHIELVLGVGAVCKK